MILLALGAVLLLSLPASAAKMTEKQKCLQGVSDVREALESEDTPELSAKRRAHVEDLMEISAHLCEQGSFRYAESLLDLARGMVVSE